MTVIGTVDFSDASNPNPFGLSVNDSVTAMAIYDNAGIPGTGNDSLEIGDSTLFSLTITLGNITYKEAGDIAFGFGGPELEFFNGNISGIGFFQIHWVIFQIYALEAFQLQRRMVCLKTNSFSMTSN